MKQITLTQGKVALVDNADFEHFNQWKWQARKKPNNKWYAVRSEGYPKQKQKTVFMHREILNAPEGMEPDHINGDGLDNRRENLRISTHTQNIWNSRKRRDNSSGYKGVTRYNKKGVKKRWVARIQYDKRRIYLGSYERRESAARAYDAAAKRLYGKFANLNFPE